MQDCSFAAIREVVANVPTIVYPSDDHVRYENIVTTVRLLPPDYILPLESLLSQNLAGFVTCGPSRFPAVVIRIRDTLGSTTHLIFRSGTMNTVGGKSYEHSRYCAQLIRQYIDHVKAPFMNPTTERIELTTLENRSLFSQFTMHLIVISTSLNTLPNLNQLLRVLPDLAKWDPELFPGLKFLIWVRPKDKCRCKRKKHKQGCQCTVRVLLFDTGKIVVTGSRTIADVNTALYLLTALFSDEQFQSNQPLLPSYRRYEARLESLQSSIEFKGYATRGRRAAVTKKRKAPPTSPFTYLKRRRIVPLPSGCDTVHAVFLESCRRGQVDHARFVAGYNPCIVRSALEYPECDASVRSALHLLFNQ